MNQPDPNAEVAPQLQATIASMLDALESSPPSALLEEAHPDLAPEQREKVWGDMLRNYAKDREAGKFSAFELDREHLEATGELSKRDQARRQLYEHIATAHGQKLNWLSESQATIKPRRPDPAEAGAPDEVLDMRERWVTDTSAWEQPHVRVRDEPTPAAQSAPESQSPIGQAWAQRLQKSSEKPSNTSLLTQQSTTGSTRFPQPKPEVGQAWDLEQALWVQVASVVSRPCRQLHHCPVDHPATRTNESDEGRKTFV